MKGRKKKGGGECGERRREICLSVCLSIGRFFPTGDYRSHDDGNSTLALTQGEARRSQVKGCLLGLNGAGK